MDFFQFKNFNDFIQKMGFTVEQGISYLDKELRRRQDGKKSF